MAKQLKNVLSEAYTHWTIHFSYSRCRGSVHPDGTRQSSCGKPREGYRLCHKLSGGSTPNCPRWGGMPSCHGWGTPTWDWGTPDGRDLGPVTRLLPQKGHGTSGSFMRWRWGMGPVEVLWDGDGVTPSLRLWTDWKHYHRMRVVITLISDWPVNSLTMVVYDNSFFFSKFNQNFLTNESHEKMYLLTTIINQLTDQSEVNVVPSGCSRTCKYVLVIPEVISSSEPFTTNVTVKRSET